MDDAVEDGIRNSIAFYLVVLACICKLEQKMVEVFLSRAWMISSKSLAPISISFV
jgi:hypothetical protein